MLYEVITRRRPFADAIEGQISGLTEGGGQKSRSRMRQMVLGKKDFPLEIELFAQPLLDPELLLEPGRKAANKLVQATRRKGQVGLEQPLETQKRFV